MASTDIIMPIEATRALPEVRRIRIADLIDALRLGRDDFIAMPTYAIFLVIIYPVIGILLTGMTFASQWVSYLYPLVAGFALIGPLAALWLYELSRRRELGLDTSWRHAFDVFHSPSLPAIALLSLTLLVLFLIWIACADALFNASFAWRKFASAPEFWRQVLTTPEGQWLIVVGNLVGLCFAIVAGALSVVSFPLLLDRHTGLPIAVLTSIRVVLRNPLQMAVWGLIVAAGLALGVATAFVGLAIVFPILGHATWHLYRKSVVRDDSPRPAHIPPPPGRRYGAEFPASLFTRPRPEPWRSGEESKPQQ